MSKKSWLYCSGGVLAFIGSVILLYDQTLWPVGVLLQVVGLLLILGTRKHNAKLAEQLPRDTRTKGWLIVIPAVLTAVGVTAVASSYFPAWIALVIGALVGVAVGMVVLFWLRRMHKRGDSI